MSTHAVAEGTEHRSVYLLAGVNLVALGSLTTPVVAGLPLKIDALLPVDQRAAALASVLMLGALAALVASPVFGALSDRTRGRFGRRRPWMLGGVVAGLAGTAALAVADTFPAIAISWVCTQIAYNATLAASVALLADTVPDSRRAAASGVFTAAAFVGTLPPLLLTALLPRHVDLVSFVMPIVALVVVGFALRVREKMPDAAPTRPRDRRAGSVRDLLTRSSTGAFAAVWLQRLAMQSGFSLAGAFTLYLVIDRMADDAVGATPVAMVATLCGGAGIVLGASVGGAWASRMRQYLPFLVCGAVGLALAASMRAFAAAPVVLWTAAAVGGLSVGIYLAVNMALAMRVLPAGRAGTYLGILNVAETIPQMLAPMAAAALLRVGSGDPISGAGDSYFALYAVAAGVALLSLATLPALRRSAPRSHR
ncbi:MFS transporter [Microbacterium sp.]|uniref:MFS transporter n=1 Tax=Microbacterium sp. TaxID=51671 RepID=UPI003F9772E0